MDGKAARNLQAILEAFNRRQAVLRQEMEAKRAARLAFLAEFAGVIRTVVRPVMEQAGALVERSGHEYDVTAQQVLSAGEGGDHAAITFTVFPEGERPRTTEQMGWPRVAFLANPSKNTVLVYECAMMPNVGGPAGTTGEYNLAELTAEVVEGHIISVLSRAMGISKLKQRLGLTHNRRVSARRRLRRHDESIAAAYDYLATLGAPRSEDRV